MPLKIEGSMQCSPKHSQAQVEKSEVAELLQVQEGGSFDDETVESPRSSLAEERVSGFTTRTKAKAKKLFRIDGVGVNHEPTIEEDKVYDSVEHDAVFRTSDLTKAKRIRPSKTINKTVNNIKSLGTAIVHPIDATKSKATRTTAGQLSKAERPFLSQNADKEYLQAHDNLKRAESLGSSKQGMSDEEQASIVETHRHKIREIEAHRDSLRAAWTTSHHVRRARVVPRSHIDFPDGEYFVEKGKDGGLVRYDWLKWLGYNLIYYTQDFSAQYIDDINELPFDLDSSRHYVERLLMASAPWQSWLMDVRAVYRWENPRTTSKWLAVYVFLWYTQHIMGFFYFYLIYIVLKNRYDPTSVESIRQSMQRALDSRCTASRFSELIDRHGRNDWLKPLLEDLGPPVQLQLGDLANMLEVFSNFYHWKHPQKTKASLAFISSCLVVSLFADMAFCMKIVWFIVGGSFFLCWPIASLYPKYRYMVSPFKWVLWDIPTHAEWSFQYLRRQGQVAREQVIKKKIHEDHSYELANPAVNDYMGRVITVPDTRVEDDDTEEAISDNDEDGWYSASSTTSVLEATDFRSFRALWHGSIGRLVVFSKGVRYVRSVPKKELWTKDFLELCELRKMGGSLAARLTSSSLDSLEIKCTDRSKLLLEGMQERDEAFNTIIAFSSLQWQSLQIISNSNAQS